MGTNDKCDEHLNNDISRTLGQWPYEARTKENRKAEDGSAEARMEASDRQDTPLPCDLCGMPATRMVTLSLDEHWCSLGDDGDCDGEVVQDIQSWNICEDCSVEESESLIAEGLLLLAKGFTKTRLLEESEALSRGDNYHEVEPNYKEESLL